MSHPVQRPKFASPLMPTKGPIVSPFEILGQEVIVSPGATLPPICLITGEVFELSKARYKLEYLTLNDTEFKAESILQNHHTPPFSAKAMVRYALCDRAMRATERFKKVGPILIMLGIIGWFPIMVKFEKSPLPAIHKAAIMLAYFGGGIFLLWLLARKRAVMITASHFDGSKIAIHGIDRKILSRMLLWQQKHSPAPHS